jgi:WD40 repeat protein
LIYVWDLEARECIKKLEIHKWKIFCLAFSPDFISLGVGSGDGTVSVW